MYAIGCVLFWFVIIGSIVFLVSDASKSSRIDKMIKEEQDECIKKQKKFYGMDD